MISCSVEISIAGGVVAMVRGLSLGRFFFFSFFFLYHVFIVKVQELACSASYGVKKTLISINQKTNENYKIISKSCQVLDTSPTHGQLITG